MDEAAMTLLADRFRGAEGLERFLGFFERLGGHVTARAKGAGTPRQAARWAEAWSEAVALAADTEALNLDRTDALWTTTATLRRPAAG